MNETRLWEEKRREVIDSGPPGCWNCGSEESPIHVHHRYYEAGKAKWDYPTGSFDALCPVCHGIADVQRRKLCRAHGLLGNSTSEMALGFMFALRAIWEYVEDTIHSKDITSAEFVMGIASAYAISDREIWDAIGRRGGILDPKDLEAISPLRNFRHREAAAAGR